MVQRRQGFTLIETLIVVALVGILATVSVGRFNSIIKRQKVSRAANGIGSTLQLAFGVASRNRAPTRITWSATNLTITVTNLAGGQRYGRVFLGSAGAGLSASQVTFSPAAGIIVYPHGLATDSVSVTVRTTDGTLQKRVRMTRAGMIQVL